MKNKYQNIKTIPVKRKLVFAISFEVFYHLPSFLSSFHEFMWIANKRKTTVDKRESVE